MTPLEYSTGVNVLSYFLFTRFEFLNNTKKMDCFFRVKIYKNCAEKTNNKQIQKMIILHLWQVTKHNVQTKRSSSSVRWRIFLFLVWLLPLIQRKRQNSLLNTKTIRILRLISIKPTSNEEKLNNIGIRRHNKPWVSDRSLVDTTTCSLSLFLFFLLWPPSFPPSCCLVPGFVRGDVIALEVEGEAQREGVMNGETKVSVKPSGFSSGLDSESDSRWIYLPKERMFMYFIYV